MPIESPAATADSAKPKPTGNVRNTLLSQLHLQNHALKVRREGAYRALNDVVATRQKLREAAPDDPLVRGIVGDSVNVLVTDLYPVLDRSIEILADRTGLPRSALDALLAIRDPAVVHQAMRVFATEFERFADDAGLTKPVEILIAEDEGLSQQRENCA